MSNKALFLSVLLLSVGAKAAGDDTSTQPAKSRFNIDLGGVLLNTNFYAGAAGAAVVALKQGFVQVPAELAVSVRDIAAVAGLLTIVGRAGQEHGMPYITPRNCLVAGALYAGVNALRG